MATTASDSGLCLSVVVFGASGDLAHRKTLPAFFHLFDDGLSGLGACSLALWGAARSRLDGASFRDSLSPHLPSEEPQASSFLSRVEYVQLRAYDGQGGAEGFAHLRHALEAHEATAAASHGATSFGRLFYLATPPETFPVLAAAIKAHLTPAGMFDSSEASLTITPPPRRAGPSFLTPRPLRWARVVIEKPFGRDLASAEALEGVLSSHFPQASLFRIDHFLGKELVQNIHVLRFSNVIFEPLLNRHNVQCVVITLKEPFGIEQRAGFFDTTGIMRDVVQNHLLQIATIVSMERPVSLSASDVHNEKHKALRYFLPISAGDVVLGQYEGYEHEKGVAPGSRTATFASLVLRPCSDRWAGVPFILRAGKCLDSKKTEVRIQFKSQPAGANVCGGLAGPQAQPAGRNELVIRVAPHEAVYCKLTVKAPAGVPLAQQQQQSSPCGGAPRIPTVLAELDLDYGQRYGAPGGRFPDAYETILRQILQGDSSNCVRSDFVTTAWRLFDPLLQAVEASDAAPPVRYAKGSRGPSEGDEQLAREGLTRSLGYVWRKAASE